MRYITLVILFIVTFNVYSQKVGLVLSGGGASAFAHIGVLKALEEHHIPIDYITGTSAGALVGAMYASGYTPQQIEALATSESFYKMTQGDIDEIYKYFIYNSDLTAEVFSYKFAVDSIFLKSLPTNLLNPTALDFELMRLLAINPPSANISFDSLFIPFRCVASDITTKSSVLFKSGDLNVAVRASMTYPFFISPIKVNGKLLFDGGLYNNFPAEDMYHEFDPDFIIGSNVSYNEPPPTEDDLMSQIRNMFSTHSNYSLPCNQGVIIEPQLGNIGTFDFDKIKEAIEIGYLTALMEIDTIESYVIRKIDSLELSQLRKNYNQKKIKLKVSDIEVTGVNPQEAQFIKQKLIKAKKKEILDEDELKKRILNLYQSDYVSTIFPTLKINTDSTQTLKISIKKEKPLEVAIGGHFSSRPVNEGFIELSYIMSKSTPLKVYANSYFGKFYGSVKLGAKFYFPTKNDIYAEPIFVMNRWDYFTSFTTFFEEVKPSFLVVNEQFWGVKFNMPIFSKGKLILDFKNGLNQYDYYQTQNFTNKDTADYTSMLFYSPGISIIRNSLNRKQFASAGSLFELKARYVHGIEHTVPGSTAGNQIELNNTFRNWLDIDLKYQTFFMRKGVYRLGLDLGGNVAFKPFLANYTATILSAKQFNPFPDAATFFFKDYRANQSTYIGLMNIFTIKNKVDFRIDVYYYQPISNIVNNNNIAEYSSLFYQGFELASTSFIYHTRVGPLRATLNYFGKQFNPLSFQLSYGYVLFNERGIK